MATKLNKPIRRETDSIIFEKGKHHNIIVQIEPTRGGALIGLRLKGHKDTYRIGVGSVFTIAIREHHAKIERRTKMLMKAEGLKERSARARARKELDKELKNQ